LYSGTLEGVVVESTYNWYWLVDALMAEGYTAHLANPAAIQKYSGLKHADDKHDAFWLAEMLRLNILPTGYIYPKEERPIRDLLRKRSHLMRLRTSLLISLQNIISRDCAMKFKTDDITCLSEDCVHPKGKGNKKNGNKCLSWAFSEAAELARRFDEKARAYYNRKLRKSNSMIAHAALAHKLARAAYFIMIDKVPFLPEKTFT
jgi:transposase